MKHGRPAMREHFRHEILEALQQLPYPVTVSTIRHLVEARSAQRSGWDTIQKYLEELVAERLVLRQPLPTQPGRKPLVVYLGRRRPNP